MEKEKVSDVIEEIKPQLQAHGGNVELVEVTDDGTVKVKLVGACAGCPMSKITLAGLIENTLKENVPEIDKVEAV